MHNVRHYHLVFISSLVPPDQFGVMLLMKSVPSTAQSLGGMSLSISLSLSRLMEPHIHDQGHGWRQGKGDYDGKSGENSTLWHSFRGRMTDRSENYKYVHNVFSAGFKSLLTRDCHWDFRFRAPLVVARAAKKGLWKWKMGTIRMVTYFIHMAPPASIVVVWEKHLFCDNIFVIIVILEHHHPPPGPTVCLTGWLCNMCSRGK